MFPVVEKKRHANSDLIWAQRDTNWHLHIQGSRALTLPRSLSLSSTMGSLFLEVLYTLGIFSNRSSAQCVKCLWPSSPFLLFSGVIGKKVKDRGEGRGFSAT